MPYGAAFPDLEVSKDIDDDAEHCAQGVKEDEVGEGGEGEGAFSAYEGVGRNGNVADGPPEAVGLVARHAATAFFESGDGEGIWEGERGAGGWFEENVGGDAGVFVFVAAALSYALLHVQLACLVRSET